MPYELKRSGDGWKVFKKGTEKSFSKKAMPRGRAEAQMRALYANENFVQKLHNVLIEGFQKSGHETITGYLPDLYAPGEPEVEIGFDWADPEPKTFDYPGSPGGIWITDVKVTATGQELDIDRLPKDLEDHFVELATDHLQQKELRAKAGAEARWEESRGERAENERALLSQKRRE